MILKKSLLVLFLLLLVVFPVSGSLFSRSYSVHSFDKCSDLFVNVSGSLVIDEGEYALRDCYVLEDEYWYCPCSNNYELILDVQLATINDYTFELEYYYEGSLPRSSSGRSVYEVVFTNKTQTDPPTPVPVPIPPKDVEPEVIYINETITKIEPCESCEEETLTKKTNDYKWLSTTLWILFILACAWWFIGRKFIKKKEE